MLPFSLPLLVEVLLSLPDWLEELLPVLPPDELAKACLKNDLNIGLHLHFGFKLHHVLWVSWAGYSL